MTSLKPSEPIHQALLELSRRDGRVCLQPQYWQRMYERLPDTRQEGSRWMPALPLILAGWAHSTDRDKRERFAEHLRWAVAHGAGEKLLTYLSDVPAEAWHHGGPGAD